MKSTDIFQTTPLSGEDVMERVSAQLARPANHCLIGMIVTQGMAALIALLFAAADTENALPALLGLDFVFGLIALGCLIGFLVCRSREKRAPEHLIFRRYGGAEGVAEIINASYGQVTYEDKKHQFRLAPTYIMRPGDLTTFMPTSHMLLACKEDRRAAAAVALLISPLIGALMNENKPSGLFLAAYNCYGDRVDYRFSNELFGGSEEIDRIVNMVQYCAPQCAVGDSPVTRAYLAQNMIMPPM